MPKRKASRMKTNTVAGSHATTNTQKSKSTNTDRKMNQQEPESESNDEPRTPDLPFRFLDLPPELRNEVYSYAMPGSNNLRSRDLATLSFPAITRASKQLREESLGFLFSECHFVICIGTNYHHRSYVLSPYAKKPSCWDIVKDCGTLGFRPAVRKFLKTAGKSALFMDVTFRVYHPNAVHAARYKNHEGGGPKGAMHLKVTGERRLEVEIEAAPVGEKSWEHIEEAKRDGKRVAEEVAKREGFRGLRMEDLHRIAKAFYWREDES